MASASGVETDFVIERSAVGVIDVEAVLLLLAGFGSDVEAEIVAVLDTVPPAAAVSCTTSVKFAVAPLTNEPMVQVTVPAAPAAGVVQLNEGPLFCVIDANVVLGGSTSVSETVAASVGPLLATAIV